ncbi:uncharacterized protein TNCV_1246811 [Trichonephila clavipes]|uniref:Uncharacterized protein n=1 Tax=Trichonephila clavipes TaxID=2585209 RepID=A0A8X6RGL5_TRICX|nr:uncharacterized protein TNCV_1246811 [Trichonephila clavipes]
MTSSAKQQNEQDSKCNREFQIWWTEKHDISSQGDKAVCVLCSGTVVCRTLSLKRCFETNRYSKNSSQTQNSQISRFEYIKTSQRTVPVRSITHENMMMHDGAQAHFCAPVKD